MNTDNNAVTPVEAPLPSTMKLNVETQVLREAMALILQEVDAYQSKNPGYQGRATRYFDNITAIAEQALDPDNQENANG